MEGTSGRLRQTGPYQSTGGLFYAAMRNELTSQVFDITGRRIAVPASFSNHEVELNISSIGAGTYMVQLIHNNTGAIEVGTFIKR